MLLMTEDVKNVSEFFNPLIENLDKIDGIHNTIDKATIIK